MSNNDFYGDHYKYMEDARVTIVKIAETASKNSRVTSRIKAPESMTAKIIADGLPVNCSSALKEESDAIGVRIIAESLVSVYKISDKLMKMSRKRNNAFRIIKVKDFIKSPKKSGYRSLHMIVAVASKDPEYPELKVEIQIRTAVMDCWASLEHMVKYKQVIDITPEIYDMLDSYKKESEREIASIQKFA